MRTPGTHYELAPYGFVKPQHLEMHGVVCAVLTHEDGSTETTTVENVITIAGSEFYAYRVNNNEIPPNNRFTVDGTATFNGIIEVFKSVTLAPGVQTGAHRGTLLAASGISVASGGMEATYPKRGDLHAQNGGKGSRAFSYSTLFAAGVGTTTTGDPIDDVIITNPELGAAEPIMSWADGLNKFKAATDTLQVFVNHWFGAVSG